MMPLTSCKYEYNNNNNNNNKNNNNNNNDDDDDDDDGDVNIYHTIVVLLSACTKYMCRYVNIYIYCMFYVHMLSLPLSEHRLHRRVVHGSKEG